MMKLKIGQPVKILDSDMEGVVAGEDDFGNIIIETNDGMLIPVQSGELLSSSADSIETLSNTRPKLKSESGRSACKNKNLSSGSNRSSVYRKVSGVSIIDLHIESVDHGYEPLVRTDYLERQIQFFRREAARLKSNGITEFIVIHGEGSGKLKSVIIYIIKELWPLSEVMDAPFHRYRFGATRVIIKSK
jgi:hypothetical protein